MPNTNALSRRALAGALSAFAVAPMPALAQGVFNMGMLTKTLSQGAQSEDARASGLAAFRSITSAPRTAPINEAAIRYQPSMAVRARNMKQLVERLRRVDPASASDLERTLASRDVVAEIAGVMRPVGLDPNNLADAAATYLVTAYYGVRGSTDGEPADSKRSAPRSPARSAPIRPSPRPATPSSRRSRSRC